MFRINNNNNQQKIYKNKNTGKINQPWWKFSNKLEEKWKIMKKSYYKMLHNKTNTHHKIKYIIAYKNFKQEKNSTIQKWITNRNKKIEEKLNQSITVNWKQWKKINKTSHKTPIQIFNTDKSIPINTKQSTNNLASTFEKIFNTHDSDTNNTNNLWENMVNSSVTYDMTINSHNALTDGLIDINDVIDRCKTCNEKTSTGPDLVHAKLIKSTNHNFHYALYIIFNYSWIHGVLPQDWKDSIIVPIYKNGEKTEGKNYRPISITSVIVRIFERVLDGRYLNLVKDKINNMQAGFRKHHTCYDHLYQMYESISSTFVKKSKLPIVFLDIEKAYDSVWQNGLLFKLNKIGITGNAWRWIKSFFIESTI
jgi:hypothetical protein